MNYFFVYVYYIFCMYIYIYIHTHTYIHTYIHTYLSAGDGVNKLQGYIGAISLLDSCVGCVDVAIIDGSARAACAAAILPYLRPDRYVCMYVCMSGQL